MAEEKHVYISNRGESLTIPVQFEGETEYWRFTHSRLELDDERAAYLDKLLKKKPQLRHMIFKVDYAKAEKIARQHMEATTERAAKGAFTSATREEMERQAVAAKIAHMADDSPEMEDFKERLGGDSMLITEEVKGPTPPQPPPMPVTERK